MDSQTAYEYIVKSRFMAGMRGAFTPDVALKTCQTLAEEGINVFEFTMNSQEPIAAMRAVKQAFGPDACVGMGTVLDIETAKRVLDAGADFIVSPAFQPDIVELVVSADILCGPGVITPTEAVLAWQMGVKLVKIFPIGSLGLDYFKAIRGPLDHIHFMCNGGMNDINARQFLEAGAVACGMANWLTGDGTWPTERIQARARILRQIAVELDTGVKASAII